MIDIDKLILEASKSRNELEKNVYRLIKAKIIEHKTAPKAKPYDEAAEFALLNKMVKERTEDAAIYTSAGRHEQAKQELDEASVIQQLLPAPVSEEEILKCVDEYISINGPITQKQMGLVMKAVKADHPTADGKMISNIIKLRLA